MSWPAVPIEDCARIVGGATPSTAVPDYWDGDIYWATPKDLSELSGHYIDSTPRLITRRGLQSCAAEVLPPNSVLFSSRAPIGHVAVNRAPMATNQGFKSFVPNLEKLHAKFLYHWLRANRPYLESLGNGATFKEVSKSVIARLELPLPPLEQQLRIAAILDAADDLRAKRRIAITKIDNLAQSIFVERFGDLIGNPKGWTQVPLAEIVRKITDGEHLNPLFSPTGMPIVMAGNVLDDFVDIPNAKKVTDSLGEQFRRKCNPEKGDLLLVSRGATIGRLCRVQTDQQFCLMGSVILIKLDPEIILDSYLSALLKMPIMKAKLYSTSGSSAQQAIYLKDLKHLSCPVPDMISQRRFDIQVNVIEKQKSILKKSLARLDALFGTLQARAFQGEL